MKNKLITLIVIIFSVLCGILTRDYYLGTLILVCGLLNSYYASIGKIYNYIFGALYSILSGYVCFRNGLYGIALLSLLVYFPSQIQGFISWNKNKDKNKQVKVRNFTVKKSIIIVTSCIISSLLFGYLLSKIPNQQLAFLDATSNVINLCGIILMNLRFKECWLVWLFNNTIDVVIWVINIVNKSPNSMMMLLVSIGYLLINVYGIIKWNKMSKLNN